MRPGPTRRSTGWRPGSTRCGGAGRRTARARPHPIRPRRTRLGYGGAAEPPSRDPARLWPRPAAPRNRLPAPPPLRLGTTHSPVADHHALDGLHGRGAGRRRARPRAELRRNARRRSGRGPESRASGRRQPSAAERRARRQPSVRRRGGARGELRRGRSPSQRWTPKARAEGPHPGARALRRSSSRWARRHRDGRFPGHRPVQHPRDPRAHTEVVLLVAGWQSV